MHPVHHTIPHKCLNLRPRLHQRTYVRCTKHVHCVPPSAVVDSHLRRAAIDAAVQQPPTMRIIPPLLLAILLRASPSSALTQLSDDDLRSIPSPGGDFDIHSGQLLAPILIPRVPGTDGNAKTQQHFVDFFKTNLPAWELSWQNSTSKTPVSGDRDVPLFQPHLPTRPAGDAPGRRGEADARRAL